MTQDGSETTDAVGEAIAAGLLSPELAAELRLTVRETGHSASACAEETGGEPLSERGEHLVRFLKERGA